MILNSLIIAFAMYSKIPMPHVEWSERNMRYSLCFYPLVGAVIGAVCFLWIRICNYAGVGKIAGICIFSAIPLMITGGLHADGFADTMDAVHSWQDRERKLEILKDSHVGAFAVIMLILYYLCFIAGLSEINMADREVSMALGLVFVYSRALTGTALVFGESAKKEGLAYSFARAGDLAIVRGIMIVWDVACVAGFVILNARMGNAMCCAGLFLILRFLTHTKKVFGGLTGDLCGCFVMMSELACVLLLWILM